MKPTESTFKLSGLTRYIGECLILEFDEPSSQQLPSRGQVAVELLSETEPRPVIVIEPDGRRGHWLPLTDQASSLGVTGAAQHLEFRARTAANWPETSVPDDLHQALAAASDLTQTWESLTPMARWEWVRWVKSTKNAATRARRVEVSISKLRAGKRRPCCFDLSSCTVPELAKSGKLIPAN
ncbi:YdeI/OmpD-associated family protein [Glutamicibacter uratoxydans]|uniref:YdeI/OmpD-associated family protein n=1 Tax=Glutamicibacter uratoxydans TaxID=43667 RepID=UPI003D6F3817